MPQSLTQPVYPLKLGVFPKPHPLGFLYFTTEQNPPSVCSVSPLSIDFLMTFADSFSRVTICWGWSVFLPTSRTARNSAR